MNWKNLLKTAAATTAIGGYCLAGAAFADDGATRVEASPASYDDGVELVIGGGFGLMLGAEVDAGGGTLNVSDGSVLEGHVAVQVNDRLLIGLRALREAGEIDFGPISPDGHLWTVGPYVEFDVNRGDGRGLFLHGGAGLSRGEVEFAFGGEDLDDGTTYGGGAGYRTRFGGLPAAIKYEYLHTDGLTVGGYELDAFGRHNVTVVFDLG